MTVLPMPKEPVMTMLWTRLLMFMCRSINFSHSGQMPSFSPGIGFHVRPR